MTTSTPLPEQKEERRDRELKLGAYLTCNW